VGALQGKLEAFYLALGEQDLILLADFPDNASDGLHAYRI
jgi:hypothetical protein